MKYYSIIWKNPLTKKKKINRKKEEKTKKGRKEWKKGRKGRKRIKGGRITEWHNKAWR